MTNAQREIAFATAAGCRARLEGESFSGSSRRMEHGQPEAFLIGYDSILPDSAPELAGLLGKLIDRRQAEIEDRLAAIESDV